MKFCEKRHIDLNDKTATIFVSIEDIKKYHGTVFYEQFKEFIKHKSVSKFGNEEGYYYVDYEFAARQTDSFLNPKG